MAIEGDGSSMIKLALDNALTAPYVLDLLSALHYSTTAGTSRHLYVQEATELQTRALTQFNEARGRQSPNIGICSLLFVSLLGIHLLHDILIVHNDSIGDFVSNFVGYMRIYRGLRDVVKLHPPEMRRSGLDPLLDLARWIGNSNVSHRGEETADLRALLESSPDSSTTSIQACLEALGWAQWVLNLKATVPEISSKRVIATMAWPLMVCEEHVKALHQRRPEALAVLAIFPASFVSTAVFLGLREHRAANGAVNCDACWAILGRLFALSMSNSERQQNFEADPFSMFLVTRWRLCSSDACYPLLRKFLEGHQINCKTQCSSVLRKQLMRQAPLLSD